MGIEFDPPEAKYPQVLPGNKAVLVSSGTGAMLVSLETMQKNVLVRDVQYVHYVPTGHLVYLRAGAVEAVPFNLKTLEVTGRPVPILERILLDSGTGMAQFAFSDEGLLIYAPGSDTHKTIPAWIDRQGNLEPLAMRPRLYGALKLSPDGRYLAIGAKEVQSNIYIFDITQGRETILTKEGDNDYPLWTPDGKRVVFSHQSEADNGCYILSAAADGSGEARLLCSNERYLRPYSLSPDGRLLTLYGSRGLGLWVLRLEGGGEPDPIDVQGWGPTFSPDGRYIAYTVHRDVNPQVFVRSYPSQDRIIPISYESGEEPIWSANGDELFYRNRDKWMVVSITDEQEFTAGQPRIVFQGPYGQVSGRSYDIAPDGRRFLVLNPQYDDSQVRELHVVTNWFEELKRLVPSPEAP